MERDTFDDDGRRHVPRGPASPFHQRISLMHGWVPLTAQIVAGVVLVLAVGWRSRRWRLLWLPVAVAGGHPDRRLHLLEHRRQRTGRRSGAPAAVGVIGVTGLAVTVGGRGLARRTLVATHHVGAGDPALRVVHRADAQSVGGLLPHRADRLEPADRRSAARSDRPRHRDRDGGPPQHSGHRHRRVGDHPRRRVALQAPQRVGLPAAGVLRDRPAARAAHRDDDRRRVHTPADWMRAGNAIKTIDEFAAAHHGKRAGNSFRRLRRLVQQ